MLNVLGCHETKLICRARPIIRKKDNLLFCSGLILSNEQTHVRVCVCVSQALSVSGIYISYSQTLT